MASRSSMVGGWLPAVLGLMGLIPSLAAQTESPVIRVLGDFEPGWWEDWEYRTLADRKTEYRVVKEGDGFALMARSWNAASGLWYMLDMEPGDARSISWRWKVAEPLTGNHREREKTGDDYVARVFVIFEPHFLRWKTRAICYVWAAHEPEGSIFENPYSSSVVTIVVKSGDAHAGEWITEERDFLADYRNVFGREAEEVSGVAIMTDTDNSGGSATAWFDEIVFAR